MNNQHQNTFLMIFVLLCSISICKSANTFENVKLEFEQQDVSFGILSKLSEFFEYSNEDTEVPIDDGEDEEYSEDEEIIFENTEDYIESGEELSKYVEEYSKDKDATPENNTQMSESYKNIVYKLCLFSAISKETTIYVTESMRV